MQAPDLRSHPPRRWNVELGGIKWLPRLIDKTRAALCGQLGSYLYGQSPVDRSLLHALGLGYRAFSRIVANSANDDDVFRALYAASPDGIERARDWSGSLPGRYAWFFFLLDVDDGYHGGAIRKWRRPLNYASAAFTRVVKIIWPSRAAKI